MDETLKIPTDYEFITQQVMEWWVAWYADVSVCVGGCIINFRKAIFCLHQNSNESQLLWSLNAFGYAIENLQIQFCFVFFILLKT